MINQKKEFKSLRNTILILDYGEDMKQSDILPTRIIFTLKIIQKFIDKYKEKNPLSSLSLFFLTNQQC